MSQRRASCCVPLQPSANYPNEYQSHFLKEGLFDPLHQFILSANTQFQTILDSPFHCYSSNCSCKVWQINLSRYTISNNLITSHKKRISTMVTVYWIPLRSSRVRIPSCRHLDFFFLAASYSSPFGDRQCCLFLAKTVRMPAAP